MSRYYLPRSNISSGKKRKRFFKKIGKEAQEKGMEAERRFQMAFLENFKKPPWFIDLVKGNKRQDSNGNDFILFTTIVNVSIQIKSSKEGVKEFKKKRRDFCGVILIIKLDFNFNFIRKISLTKIDRFLKDYRQRN